MPWSKLLSPPELLLIIRCPSETTSTPSSPAVTMPRSPVPGQNSSACVHAHLRPHDGHCPSDPKACWLHLPSEAQIGKVFADFEPRMEAKMLGKVAVAKNSIEGWVRSLGNALKRLVAPIANAATMAGIAGDFLRPRSELIAEKRFCGSSSSS